jgi:hypothetical protein
MANSFFSRSGFRGHGRHWLRRAFELGQMCGFDLLPRHYYSEIPDVRELRRTQWWRGPLPMGGIQGADCESQIAFLQRSMTSEVAVELQRHDVYERAVALHGEPGYSRVDADVLFAVVATGRPQTIIQIGCGVSTAVCLEAADYAGYRPRIICIEPYPSQFLVAEADRGRIELRRQKAQAAEPSLAAEVGGDGLFFVDSSHALGPAGEATRIILQMLPLLEAGAMAHFHDIFFPYDYHPWTLSQLLFFPHESPLLHAFLTGNSRFQLLLSLAMLHHRDATGLMKELPRYEPAKFEDGLMIGPGDFPSAAYLRVTA